MCVIFADIELTKGADLALLREGHLSAEQVRSCYVNAIPLTAMDVVIDPKQERLIVNPDSPNFARMMLM